jgi:hypothetical protein
MGAKERKTKTVEVAWGHGGPESRPALRIEDAAQVNRGLNTPASFAFLCAFSAFAVPPYA